MDGPDQLILIASKGWGWIKNQIFGKISKDRCSALLSAEKGCSSAIEVNRLTNKRISNKYLIF
jgi:hypothetical protein